MPLILIIFMFIVAFIGNKFKYKIATCHQHILRTSFDDLIFSINPGIKDMKVGKMSFLLQKRLRKCKKLLSTLFVLILYTRQYH